MALGTGGYYLTAAATYALGATSATTPPPAAVVEPTPWLQYSAATDAANNFAIGTTLYTIKGTAGPTLNAEGQSGMSLSTDAVLGNIPVPASTGPIGFLRATEPTPSNLLGSGPRWLDLLTKVSGNTTELFGYGSRQPNGCFDLVYDGPSGQVGMNFGGNSSRFAPVPLPANTWKLIQVGLDASGNLRVTNGTTTTTAAALDIAALVTGLEASTLDNLRVALGLTGSLFAPSKYIAYVALGVGERSVAQEAAARDRILAQFNNLFS